MTISNKHLKRSKISEAKFREFIRYFSLDLDAHKIAFLTGLNRNTVNRYLLLLRKRIAEFCEQSSPFSGEIEVDESYFGARRIKGKRGRGKTPVFGILQQGVARSIPGSFLTAPERPCKPSFAAKWSRRALFTPMPGAATVAWFTWDTKSIIVSTMAMTSLPMVSVILTASNLSGLIQNAGS